MSHPIASPCKTILVCLLLIGASSHLATAERTLRWKVKPGDELALVMTQEMTQVLKMGTQPEPVTIKNDMTTDMTWSVKSVDPQGQITITQTIRRIRMKTDLPELGLTNIDTQGDEAPNEIGEQMLKSLKPLIGLEISQVMNNRGKVLDVTIPQEAFQNTQSNPLANQMFSPKMLEDMTRKFSLQLPEQAVKVGHAWSTNAEMDGPVGKVTVKNDYTYDGISQEEGQEGLDKIKLKMQMDFPGGGEDAPGTKIDVKQQNSHGYLLFDVDAGRLVSSEVQQDMKMQITFAGQNIDQTISNLTKMTLSPIEN